MSSRASTALSPIGLSSVESRELGWNRDTYLERDDQARPSKSESNISRMYGYSLGNKSNLPTSNHTLYDAQATL